MMRVHIFERPVCSRKLGIFLLASAMCLGCAAGIWLSFGAEEGFADARHVLSAPAEGAAPVVISLLPLLLSAAAVYVRQPVFLLPLAFWKVLFFSYVFSGFMSVWIGGDWLVCSLGMFSAICSLPVLCWYWLRHIGGQEFCLGTFCPALAVVTALSLMDLYVISPFLAKILIY